IVCACTTSILAFFLFFFFSSRRRHTRSVSAFLLNRSSDLKLCLMFKLAPSVCRMTFPILASLLVRLVVLLPFQLLRLSLATPSRSEERRVGKECRSRRSSLSYKKKQKIWKEICDKVSLSWQ